MKIYVGEQVFNYTPELAFNYENAPEWAKPSLSFLKDYHSGLQELAITTSGSTGTPKTIILSRNQLEKSAFKTNSHFGLEKSDVFYCCINTHYIGGKMMLIRAAELDADIILAEATSNPFSINLPLRPTFMAVVPLQLANLVQHWETLLSDFGKLKNIIVGGGAIPPMLEKETVNFRIPIYHTYGMTETVSHIALRRVNGYHRSGYFTAMPMVEVKTSEEGALRLRADVTNGEWMQTNDLVEVLSPTTFRFKGRLDFVINSGGIKLHLDALEQEIGTYLPEIGIKQPFILAGLPDKELGQRLVLIIELFDLEEADSLKTYLKAKLHKYHDVKQIFSLPSFAYTPNGKIDRNSTVALLSL
jgi:O-succinylbenzoic acid--CoA ligase